MGKGLNEYLPNLASSLDNLGIVFSELHRPKDGLVVAEEATEIRRRLAERHPSAYKSDLARSLHNMACTLAVFGRKERAAAVYEESMALRKTLAQDGQLSSIADLAESFGAQGKMRLDAGKPDEALKWFSDELDQLTPHLELPETKSLPMLDYLVRGFLISAKECQRMGLGVDEARFASVVPAARALGMLPE